MSQTSSGHVGMLPLKRVRAREEPINSPGKLWGIIYATLSARFATVFCGRVHANTLAKVVHDA